jgi:hypothetical protein
MADFSIGDALGSGFGLMVRRPLSVMAWGLVYVLLGLILPLGLLASVVGPDLMDFVAKVRLNQFPTSDGSQFMPVWQAKMMMVEPVLFLAPPLVQAILAGAVFRAVLEPRDRGFAYLRLGRREFWIAVVVLVAGVLATMLMMLFEVAGLVGGLVLNGVFEAQHLDWTSRICVYVGLGLVLLAVFLGICVRFSLALPMSFAEGHFRLFESWSLTRRHGWKLFGLALLVGVISSVMMLLFEGLLVGAVFAAMGATHVAWAALPGVLQNPQILLNSGLAWWVIAAAAAFSLGMGAVFAIAMAPWAVAYRELSSTRPPSPREGGLYEPAPALMPPAPDPAPASAASLQLAPQASHDHAHADPHGGVADDGHDGQAHDGPVADAAVAHDDGHNDLDGRDHRPDASGHHH